MGEENEEDESSQSNKNADLELSILSASDSIDAAVDVRTCDMTCRGMI